MAKNTEVRDPITGKMPIKGHLVEMRDRIARVVIALVITTAFSLIFTQDIIEILKFPAGDIKLQAVKLTENLGIYFKVGLSSGVVIAMPYLVYQLFAFIAPGLTSKEKKLVFQLLPFITILFLGGVAFAYFIALPPALTFLNKFMADVAENQWLISDYINVVTRMLIVIGLVFETPIIIMLLARMGLVSPSWLANKRRWWIVLAFVISALVTPTMDPITQSIIAIPLILLLELGIILARMVYKKRETPSPAGASKRVQTQE